MDARSLAELKDRHSFEEWQGRSTLQENLFLWKFFLSGSEIPKWRPHRIDTIQPEGFPPSIQSIWTPDDGDGSTLLRVDAYECASRQAAHEFMTELLGDFQSPEIRRDDQSSVGDVAFTGGQGYSVLFARANMVLLVQNAERELMSVADVAGGLDAELTRRPGSEDHAVVPLLERVVVAAEAKAGQRIPIVLEASDPLDRPLWFKFFSTLGEVVLEGGQPLYTAADSGQDQLTVYAINENRGATSQTVQIRVE